MGGLDGLQLVNAAVLVVMGYRNSQELVVDLLQNLVEKIVLEILLMLLLVDLLHVVKN